MPAMAGVAGHAGRGDMRLPVGVDVPRHLDHAAGDLLGVEAVVGHVFGVMAIGAARVVALLRRDPGGEGQHHPIELLLAEIAEDLHVLIDFVRALAVGRSLVDRVGQHVGELERAHGRGVVI